MEEKAPAHHPASAAAPQHPAPAHPPQHAPAMDVVPPNASMAVRPEPSPEKTGHQDKPGSALPHKETSKQKPQKPAKTKKQSQGVGVAITATVIIVLSLAAMATYAFIKTQK